jgi:ArsR family transcriptional regulator
MAMNARNGTGHFLEQLRALADPTRLRILQMLGAKGRRAAGESAGMCARDIKARVKLSQPTVSHHMKILAEAGLVTRRRRGQWMWYQRDETAVKEMARRFKNDL